MQEHEIGPGRNLLRSLGATLLMGLMLAAPAFSHHSFAMYDQTVMKTMSGKLVRWVPGAGHAQLYVELLDEEGKPILEDGKPVTWGVETASAAALARQGVTRETFPLGTIVSVTLHPLRDGRTFGGMTSTSGRLIKCGTSMPKGGCTSTTGTVFLGDGSIPPTGSGR